MNITIKQICPTIIQSPAADNNYHAVCIVNITTINGSYSSIGEAQGSNETNIIGLLQQAENNGFERAMQKAEKYNVQSISPIPVSSNYSKNAGGGEKPITESQIFSLNQKYCKPGLEQVVKQKFNTNVHDLKGWQAQILFDEFYGNVKN